MEKKRKKKKLMKKKRQYIQAGTHNFKADGVLLYPDYTLPGYMALFRHYDGTLDLGSYFLPGGAAKESDIAEIYATKVRIDPFISRALGKNFVPLERVKVASLRLGGVKQVRKKGKEDRKHLIVIIVLFG